MAEETVRTALGSTYIVDEMLESRHRPDKESEQCQAHLHGGTVGSPALDRKLVGKGIAMRAQGSFQYSKAVDPRNAEPGSQTDHLHYLLSTAVNPDVAFEMHWWLGIQAALQSFLTC